MAGLPTTSLALAFVLGSLLPGAPGPVSLRATEVDGRTVALAAPGRTRAVVLFFVASDCPISNREIPEMLRVRQQYAEGSVRFWFVYPNVTESAASIHAHLAAYGLGPEALRDPHGELARLTGARLTPEAAVLLPAADGTLRPVYIGRIDDRYLRIGQERPHATQYDLAEAVSAVLAGRQPTPPGGPAVGCGIVGSR